MEILLTPDELKSAIQIGVDRFGENKKLGTRDAHGFKDSDGRGLAISCDGSSAEAAVCKFLGVKHTKGTWGDDDAGIFQVRSTRYKNGHLCLHPTDNDTKIFILVVNNCPVYNIVGWILCSDGKNEIFWGDKWKNGRKAFWIPQSELCKDLDFIKKKQHHA